MNDCLYLGDKRRDISDLNSLLAKEYEDAETAWVNREGGKLEINGQKYDSMQEYVVGFILSRYLINEKNEPFTISAGKTYQYCIGPKKVDYVVPVEYLQDGARRGVCLEWHPSGSQRIRDRYKCARRALADNDGKVAYVIADRHINNNINSLYEFVNEQCRVRDGFPGKEGFGIVFKDELQRITKLRELSKQKMVWLDLDCELRGRDVSDLSDAEVMTFWSKESTKQNQFGSRFKYSKRIMNFLNYTGATNLLWSIAIRRYLEQFYRGGQDLFADDDGKVRWIMRSVSSQIEKYLPLDLQSKLPNLEDDGLADGGRVYGKFIQHVFGREDLAAVKFENCVFKGCNFRDVACEGVRFEECVFEECVFEGLQLVGSDFGVVS